LAHSEIFAPEIIELKIEQLRKFFVGDFGKFGDIGPPGDIVPCLFL
jgi:hypothetical protein